MKDERIFPIMNKFDRIWYTYPDKTFFDIYNEITKGEIIDDKEFTKRLTIYIENDNTIK